MESEKFLSGHGRTNRTGSYATAYYSRKYRYWYCTNPHENLVNVFNNINRPNSKQTLILPAHNKSQLSYAAITEKFCIRKLYNLWKDSKKARLKKSTRKMRMVSRSWQNCLEGPQNCPQGRQGRVFVYFLPRGRNFAKIFFPGAGNLTTLKNSPGISPGGGMLVLGTDWRISGVLLKFCCCCFLINPLKAGKNSHLVKIQCTLSHVSDSPKYDHSVENTSPAMKN